MSVFNRLHPDRVTPIDQSRVYQVDDDGTSHAAPTLLPTTNADGLAVVPMSQAQLWEFDLRGWICLPGLLSAEQVAAGRESLGMRPYPAANRTGCVEYILRDEVPVLMGYSPALSPPMRSGAVSSRPK